MPKHLIFVVDDVVFIKGRGLVLTPGLWGEGEATIGDIVEIRSADGQITSACIKSIDWQRRSDHQPAAVRMGQPGPVLITPSNTIVKRGDEVWST